MASAPEVDTVCGVKAVVGLLGLVIIGKGDFSVRMVCLRLSPSRAEELSFSEVLLELDMLCRRATDSDGREGRGFGITIGVRVRGRSGPGEGRGFTTGVGDER